MKNNNPQLTTFVRQGGAPSRPDDFSAMAQIMFVLTVIDLMAVYYYGLRALLVTLLTVLVCWGLDCLCLIAARKPLHIHDLSPVVTGLALAAMLPASVPYTVAAAAAAFAICIAKQPFGGHGNEMFSSAAAGYIFAELSYPQVVLMYPLPMTEPGLENIVSQPLFSSFSKSSMAASTVSYTDFELLIGNFTGPMGCTFTVLIIVCALVLVMMRAISGTVLFTELGAVALWNLLTGGLDGVKIAFAGGMLIFSAAFLSCDPAIVPTGKKERLFYGLLSGLLIIAVSEISTLENPAVYASVIAAPFGAVTLGQSRTSRKKNINRLSDSRNDIKESLIKAQAIVSDPRKSVTERAEKRFNQRFLKETMDMIGADENGKQD